ncbi:unnamed protein product [Brachionus calyciflorus]|uniref:Uncharacterized protein n=1 Tax=Brachionus calyciflorus TaxID=104777 RepID=A0A813ZFU2_9BILA|nr:unnamed protein product [Brachionus calyciflorus]
MMSRNMGVAIASGLGLAFVGYCVYFDKKRRSHPDFKKNLLERRRKQQLEKENASSVNYPDLTDEAAVQKFLMTEIAIGEQMMAMGDIQNGVEHVANAVAVSAHKENFLSILRTTLPDPIFKMLVERLPEVSRKIYNIHKQRQSSSPQFKFKTTSIQDEPVATEPKIVEIPTDNLAIDDLLD